MLLEFTDLQRVNKQYKRRVVKAGCRSCYRSLRLRSNRGQIAALEHGHYVRTPLLR